MKIMNEYTYTQIRKNKRHSISIIVSIVISSALLFSMCIFAYSFWQSKINSTIDLVGNWHGELFEEIAGDKLQVVNDDSRVEKTMVKGSWYTAKLNDSIRPYFLLRDGDKNFWEELNLKNTVMEGRVPQKEGEIVVAKQYFIDNPECKVGDVIKLPVGNRVVGDKVLETRDYKNDNETFDVIEEKNFTIVGMLDVSGTSAYPGYIAMGYLNPADVKDTDELTVYVNLKKPSTIYKTLDDIAKEAGLEPNSKGLYNVKYNTSLLILYGIGENSQLNVQLMLIIFMIIVVVILAIGTFVLIIYNAFSLSANSRVKELSILKSLGATPKQIKYSVLFEGFILWLVQTPIGICIGYIFSMLIFKSVNSVLSVMEDYTPMTIYLSWQVVVVALLISLITVLISAYIPARKMAKIPAVEGINNNISVKKLRDHHILYRFFKMEGELAGRQFAMNKKSLRTAILSLAICITLVVSYISVISIYNYAESMDKQIIDYDLSLNIKTVEETDADLIDKLTSIDKAKECVLSKRVGMAMYVNESDESSEFKAAGGFKSVDMKYSVEKIKDKYKIGVKIIGLDRDQYSEYAKQLGVDGEVTSNDKTVNAIICDSTYHDVDNSSSMDKIPMLNLLPERKLHLYENNDNLAKGDFELDVNVLAVTNMEIGDFSLDRYTIAVVVPMDVYNSIVSNFDSDRALEMNSITIDYKVGDANSIQVEESIDEVCKRYIGTDDYSIWSLLEDNEVAKVKQKATSIAIYAIALMFGIIGLFNACSTITNNLLVHKRDYAMLRSIGLTPKGLNKMLLLEGGLFVVSPIVISIPIVLLISGFMLNVASISIMDYIRVFPFIPILLYIAAMILAIFGAYIVSSKTIKTNNVMEAISNEII